MAKTITGSLVLVLLVTAILNSHTEAAGRGAEPPKHGSVYEPEEYGGFPFPPPPPFIACLFWYKLCLFWPYFCPDYQKMCVYSRATGEEAGPNAQSVAKSSNVPLFHNAGRILLFTQTVLLIPKVNVQNALT